ncbi:hypothetical protein CEE37_06455, partial [candidate division LCP-89 bacterium B3_LCP]
SAYVDMYLVKTDSLGDTLWTKTFGATWGWDECRSVQQTTDGGYILGGFAQFGPSGLDMYLVKTDSLGDTLWTKTFGGSDYDQCLSVQQTSDGGYILGGGTHSFGAGFLDMYLVKTDSLGDMLWTKTFGGIDDCCFSVQQTIDGGYILGGMTAFGAGWNDMYLVRLEAEGPPQVAVLLTPYNPPIQIPSGGGGFRLDFEIVNVGTAICNVDSWIDITLPGGYMCPIAERENLVIAAGGSISWEGLTQYVPGAALAGTYFYNAYVWERDTWEVYAEDHFPFVKLPGNDAPVHNFGWALFGWEDAVAPNLSSTTDECILCSAHPNPFNPQTHLSFTLPKAGDVSLVIYDVRGSEVARLIDRWSEAGEYSATFDGSQLSSGVYFARLQVNGFQQTKKLLLVK